MPSLSLCQPDEIDIEANALQIMATSVMVAVSDALDDFMSSLEKFKDVIKLEFTCMRRSYGAKIYFTLRSVEHSHCICGGKVKVHTIGEVMILQHFLQGCLFAAEFVYHESMHNNSTLPVYR